MSKIRLMVYSSEFENETAYLIQSFWLAHNDYKLTLEDCKEDIDAWTLEGHILYLIKKEDQIIGFAHMGSRGAGIDWLEDLFILPSYQGNGYGSEAVCLLEQIVREYSDSLYIEVAARNRSAARLYRRLGYNVLNTITVRKDFHPEKYETVSTETISGCDYVIRK